MSVATDTLPLVIIAGKDFDHSWEDALTESGPAEPLDDVGAIEFRMSRDGLPETDVVIWSLASGHFSIVGTEMVLRVSGTETDALKDKLGSWRWLLSYGETEAEKPWVQGRVTVTPEP